ncbi:hypothetical protein RCH21_003332 [Arthrobacter sp. PL16]|uniref:recombinase family protein n=1 Tax=Arthrobacter sp. PL16 TaxID=3071720 RepID=UPI002E036F8C|nr:hypothetical protein [Arthrobacter sp. PL16]
MLELGTCAFRRLIGHPSSKAVEALQQGEQNLDGQTDALDYLRAGDTLVVTKLDRLGRSVRNLKDVVDGLEKQGVTSASDSPWKGDDTGLPTVSPNADQQSPAAYIGSGPATQADSKSACNPGSVLPRVDERRSIASSTDYYNRVATVSNGKERS